MAKCAWLIAWMLLAPGVAGAGPVTVRFEGGYVSVTAQNASVREILAEWARQGRTRIVNAEKLIGPPVTLELSHVPEKRALEVLLRSAAGYVVAPRPAGLDGPSTYDRVLIMATSAAAPAAPPMAGPRVIVAPRPPVFTPPGQPGTVPDENDEPVTVGPNGQPMPEPPDETQASFGVQPPFPVQQGEGAPTGAADPNAPVNQVPVVPGPTPLPEGVITQPMPGQIPVPQQQPKP